MAKLEFDPKSKSPDGWHTYGYYRGYRVQKILDQEDGLIYFRLKRTKGNDRLPGISTVFTGLRKMRNHVDEVLGERKPFETAKIFDPSKEYPVYKELKDDSDEFKPYMVYRGYFVERIYKGETPYYWAKRRPNSRFPAHATRFNDLGKLQAWIDEYLAGRDPLKLALPHRNTEEELKKVKTIIRKKIELGQKDIRTIVLMWAKERMEADGFELVEQETIINGVWPEVDLYGSKPEEEG